MAVVTPTVTTEDRADFDAYLQQVASFAGGVHIDFADGEFAPAKLVPIADAQLPKGVINHVHVMYRKPNEHVNDLIALGADLVILHAESDDVVRALKTLQESGVRTGIALLADTPVTALEQFAHDELFDHVLLFEGRLGYQGSEANLDGLKKVADVRAAYLDVEIGWDGGIDDVNIRQIVDAGVDILNVGGYIHDSDDPQKAYDRLTSLIQS